MNLRKSVISTYFLIALGYTSTQAVVWTKDSNYSEIPQPSIRMCIESMQAHQAQWSASNQETMHLNVPGFIREGGFNTSKGGRIRMVPYCYWTVGAADETGRPYDLMIESVGRSFFCVRLPDGKVGYTRDGRLSLDSNRRLIQLAGSLPLLNENDQDIILPQGSDLTVSKAGVIFVNNNPIDKIKVVTFENEKGMNNYLEKLNGTVFKLVGTPSYDPDPSYGIRQGFLEHANFYKALLGNQMYAKYANEGSAKIARSQIKLLTTAVQMANP